MPILTSLWIDFFQVDFDKSKHLADSTIKQRALEREKIIKQEQEKEESERKRNELEEIKRAQERYFDQLKLLNFLRRGFANLTNGITISKFFRH
jgi:hypothetical protein